MLLHIHRRPLVLIQLALLTCRAAAQGRRARQSLVFMGKIFLHRRQQLAQQIATLLQGHVDAGARLLHFDRQPLEKRCTAG